MWKYGERRQKKNSFTIVDILSVGIGIYLKEQPIKLKPTREEYEAKIKSLEDRIKELEKQN